MNKFPPDVLQNIANFLPKLCQYKFIDDSAFGVICCNAYYSTVAIASHKLQINNVHFQFLPWSKLFTPIFADLHSFSNFLQSHPYFTPTSITFDGIEEFINFVHLMPHVYEKARSISLNIDAEDFHFLDHFDLNQFLKLDSLSVKPCHNKHRFSTSDFQKFQNISSLKCEVHQNDTILQLPRLRVLEINACVELSQLNLQKLTLKSISTQDLDFCHFPKSLEILAIDICSVDNVFFNPEDFPYLQELNLKFIGDRPIFLFSYFLHDVEYGPAMKTLKIEFNKNDVEEASPIITCELPYVETLHIINNYSVADYKPDKSQEFKHLYFSNLDCRLEAPQIYAPNLKTLQLNNMELPSFWSPPPSLENLTLSGIEAPQPFDLSELLLLKKLELKENNFTMLSLPENLKQFRMRGCRTSHFSCPQNLEVLDVGLFDDQKIDFSEKIRELTLIQYNSCKIFETNFISKLKKLQKLTFKTWELKASQYLHHLKFPESLSEITVAGVRFPPNYTLPNNVSLTYANIFDLS